MVKKNKNDGFEYVSSHYYRDRSGHVAITEPSIRYHVSRARARATTTESPEPCKRYRIKLTCRFMSFGRRRRRRSRSTRSRPLCDRRESVYDVRVDENDRDDGQTRRRRVELQIDENAAAETSEKRRTKRQQIRGPSYIFIGFVFQHR